MTTTTSNSTPATGHAGHTNYVIGAWVVLMVLTAATWVLGAEHDLFGLDRNTVMVSILVLTFGKICVVGNAFMELRDAAPWLVRTFTAWCIGLCAVLSVMYLTI